MLDISFALLICQTSFVGERGFHGLCVLATFLTSVFAEVIAMQQAITYFDAVIVKAKK